MTESKPKYWGRLAYLNYQKKDTKYEKKYTKDDKKEKKPYKNNYKKMYIKKYRIDETLRKGLKQLTVMKLLNKENGGEIPFSPSMFFGGTQCPTIVMRSDQIAWQCVSTTMNQSVATQASLYSDYLNLTGIFDEYRFMKIKLEVIPTRYSVVTPDALVYCIIDYTNATQLTSTSLALACDTCKKWQPNTIGDKKEFFQYAKIQPLPDEDWYPTTTNNFNPCWFKFFSSFAFGNGEVLGWVILEAEVQFRQSI